MLDQRRYAQQLVGGIGALCLLVGFGFSTFQPGPAKLQAVLVELGQKPPAHYVARPDTLRVKQGWDLISKGYTHRKGRKTKKISSYFICLDCHSIEPEFPNLARPTSEGRLALALERNDRYLPASSFYGMVNQPSWYNNDYELKYGSLVEKARTNFREAIQLCAKECSSGRNLKAWEEEAILHYLWTLQLSMEDLFKQERELQQWVALPDGKKLSQLSERLPRGNQAHFTIQENFAPNELENVPTQDGAFIYSASCLSCHAAIGPAKFKLHPDAGQKILQKYLFQYESPYNLYRIVRNGTHPLPGKKAYMPQFTQEKMSSEQLQSLASYIYHYE